jgi:NAD(P)-dependent dehydrogenase (short-subunit alcohol dehydrogenase family)
MRLQNKVAIITGASRGIGRAIALGFAAEGAHTVLAARTLTEVEAVAAEARAASPPGQAARSVAAACDVADEEQVKTAVAAAMGEFGRIDVLVNNAGIGASRPVWGMPKGTFERLISVNLTGTFLFTKHAWKPMRAGGGGSIINVSSLGGRRGYAMLSGYCASKWGQIGFTMACAEEGKPDRIRANVLAPGKADTAIRAAIPEDKALMLQAEDNVGAAVFLASDEARYITGQVLEVEWFA